jgi:hypothetical protein
MSCPSRFDRVFTTFETLGASDAEKALKVAVTVAGLQRDSRKARRIDIRRLQGACLKEIPA